MRALKTLLLATLLVLAGQAGNTDEVSERDPILEAVANMNAAWDGQDVSTCLTFYTADTDFENSFGWTIHGRDSLGLFLEWLFDRYPRQEGTQAPETASTVDVLGQGLALVDSVRVIHPSDEQAPPRSIRTTQILRQESGRWLIWKTRIWEQRSPNAVPTDLVAPTRFDVAGAD